MPVGEHLSALVSEGVLDASPMAGRPSDQPEVDQTVREGAERLVALKRYDGKVVAGGAGHSVDRAQGIPLHQGDSHLAEGQIHGAVGARVLGPSTDRSAFLRGIAEQWNGLDPTTFPFMRSVSTALEQHDDRTQFLAGIDFILAGMPSR